MLTRKTARKSYLTAGVVVAIITCVFVGYETYAILTSPVEEIWWYVAVIILSLALVGIGLFISTNWIYKGLKKD